MEEPSGSPASAARAPYRREAMLIVAFGLAAAAALLLIDYLVAR